MKSTSIIGFLTAVFLVQCGPSENETAAANEEFPGELVRFNPFKHNPVFAGTGAATWDREIRERGYIFREDSNYYLWYTGYKDLDSTKYLGYATSTDGITWTRYKDNPIYDHGWVEDVFVIKSDSIYYMFAEGKGDTAHMLTSTDRIHWTERGNLDIRKVDDTPISKGPFGTPAVWKENKTWYLFYERDDLGIWLATSTDLKKWKNIQDEPVLKMGPGAYDKHAVAMNQVIKYKGLYYGYYHASAFKDWHEWSTNIAVSKDLIHWEKYPHNPIIENNRSSGIIVDDGRHFRLYTMHPEVYLFTSDPAP